MIAHASLRPRQAERGNVFAMLFGAVALTGVLTAVSMQTLTGPVTTITRVTQRNVAENNLLMNTKILVNAAVTGVTGGDADGDGIIEPAAFISAGAGETPPTNGGFLPTDLGLALTDPWGTRYGYCVWDHGTTNSSANRITGDNTISASTQPVIAIIAAGPDKQFQTNCPTWSGGPITVSRAAGSDDLIEHYTYAEATASSNGLWTLNTSDQAKAELKDSGGTPRVTIDRSTGIGDFLGIATDTLAARSSVLTLDGGLRLDTDANVISCAAGDAGVIRFNTTSGKLEVCNGSLWKAAGSDLWLENGTHIYSANTGNVGIGTSTPAQKLDVAGNAAVSGNTSVGGNGSVGGTLGVTGATSLGDTLAVTGATILSSTLDVTGNTTVDSGTLFVDAANNRVGIGTDSPSQKLTVTGGQIGLDHGQGILWGANSIYGYSSGTDAILINIAGTERMRIDSLGNAGIGSTTPAATLDVAGGIKVGADPVCNASKAGMVAWNTNQLQVCNGSAFLNVRSIAKLDDIGDVYLSEAGTPNNNDILAWNAADNRWEAKNINTIGSAIATPGGADKQVQFNDGGTLAGAAQLFWDNANYRLGVGTAFPNSQLHVLSTTAGFNRGITNTQVSDNIQASTLFLFKARGTEATPTAVQAGDALGSLYFGGYDGTAYNVGALIIGMTEQTFTPSERSSYLDFWTVSGTTMAERMRITSAGNVGIGVIAPVAKLDVAGGARVGADATCNASKAGMLAWNSNTLQVCTDAGTFTNIASASGGSNQWSNGAAGAIYYNGGNVGIGTTSPTQRLHIFGGAGESPALLLSANAGGANMRLRMVDSATAGLQIETGSGTGIMSILNAGNVGIGTMTPQGKLDVHQGNDSIVLYEVSDNYLAIQSVLDDQSLSGYSYGGVNNQLVLQPLVGNVGIGTTSYTYKLQVAGQIAGAGAYVNTSDARLKTEIADLDYGLETVMRLRPVSFHWKEQKDEWQRGRKLGLIAQEIEQVVPEVVTTAHDDIATKSIAYGDLTPILIKAVQELKAANDNQDRVQNLQSWKYRQEIDALKAANDNLRAELRTLQKEINTMRRAQQ